MIGKPHAGFACRFDRTPAIFERAREVNERRIRIGERGSDLAAEAEPRERALRGVTLGGGGAPRAKTA